MALTFQAHEDEMDLDMALTFQAHEDEMEMPCLPNEGATFAREETAISFIHEDAPLLKDEGESIKPVTAGMDLREKMKKSRPMMLLVAGVLLLFGTISFAVHEHNLDDDGQWVDLPSIQKKYHAAGVVVADTINLAAHRPICDPVYVANTCLRINQETPEYFGGTIDADDTKLYARELQKFYMASRESVINMLEKAGVQNVALIDRDVRFAVDCQQLCERLVSTYPPKVLPPVSDVGCMYHYTEDGAKQTLCNTDCSTQFLSYKFDRLFNNSIGELPRVHNGTTGESAAIKAVVESALVNNTPETDLSNPFYFKNISFRRLRMLILNSFHIFPPFESATVDAETGRRLREEKVWFGSPYDSQAHVAAAPSAGDRRLAAANPKFDLPNTLALAQQGKAYIATAQKKLASKQIPHIVRKWYGTNSDATRTHIKSVMNGVVDMLSNVEYVYPGPRCGPNYLAYVYKTGSQSHNAEGKYIFNICPDYTKKSDTTKIETLLHEGSHHLPMDATDAKYAPLYGALTLYGKEKTQGVAKACCQNAPGSCEAILRNAENFCYFVCDAHAARVSNSPTDTTKAHSKVDCNNLDKDPNQPKTRPKQVMKKAIQEAVNGGSIR